ncbi:MAG: hypothetical protein JNK65_09275 [Deltaproteobacteria bacterium]|nr:hypothetical protein [Deltaproteobacteria bacterium]
MTPPIAKPAAPTCTPEDQKPVDLSPFQSLPDFNKLPNRYKKDEKLQQLYTAKASYLGIDQQLGNKDSKLDLAEVDAVLQKTKTTGTNSCTLLKQARFFAEIATQIKADLSKPVDLSPIDLSAFQILPELNAFLKIPAEVITNLFYVDQLKTIARTSKDAGQAQDAEKKASLILSNFITSMKTAGISDALQKEILSNPALFSAYQSAYNVQQFDYDKDGKISKEDLATVLKNLPEGFDKSSFLPENFLPDNREIALNAIITGFSLRRKMHLKSDANFLLAPTVVGLYMKAPQLVKNDPILSAVFSLVAKVEEGGQNPQTAPKISMTPIGEDQIVSRDEFLKSPQAQELKKKLNITNDQTLFAMVRERTETLLLPLHLWPSDLKELLKKDEMGKMTILQTQELSPDEIKSEMIINFLEMTSWGKFEQEKMDHEGSEGIVISTVTKIASGGKWSWNKHFQEDRPNQHRAERDGAIELLKNTMRSYDFQKVEDAINHMEKNGKGDQVKILREQCDLSRWMTVANIEDRKEQIKAMQQAAKDYRVGDYKFWEFPILPIPRLGSGGFFDRASHLENWTFKSPELPITVSIDNYLAATTPNNWHLTHKLDITNNGMEEVLLGQLVQVDPKTKQMSPTPELTELSQLLEKASKNELEDIKAAEAILAKTSLTSEGRETLTSLLNFKITLAKNLKIEQEVSKLDFYQALEKTSKEKADMILMAFRAIGSGETYEKLKPQLGGLGLNENDFDTLKSYLEKIKPLPKLKQISIMDTLFREAQFGDKEARVKELFHQNTRSNADNQEFSKLLEQSKLSATNKGHLFQAYENQPYTVEVATPASNEFLEITGKPRMTPDQKVDVSYSGSLHSGIRITVDRAVGVAMLAGPTLGGGGIGLAVAKADPKMALLGGATVGALGGFIASDQHGDAKKILGYTAGGAVLSGGTLLAMGKMFPGSMKDPLTSALYAAGAGATAGMLLSNEKKTDRNMILGGAAVGLSTYGAARFFKVKQLNPWWGAIGLGVAGTAFTVSPLGTDWRNKSFEVMKTPYRPWSDLAMMNLPGETFALYVDWYVGCKAMEGILGGVKAAGSMNAVEKIAEKLHVTPQKVTVGVGSLLGGGLGYLSADSKASSSDKWKQAGAGAALGGTFGLKNKTLFGAAVGGTVGYISTDPKASDSYKISKVLAGALAGGAVGYTFSRIMGSRAPWWSLGDEGGEVGLQWAKEQMASLEGQINFQKNALEKFNFSNPATVQAKQQMIVTLEAQLDALKRLTSDTKYGAFSRQALNQAAKMEKEASELVAKGGAEGAQGEQMYARYQDLLARSVMELEGMVKMETANKKTNQLLLSYIVADKMDNVTKPNLRVIPPLDEGFLKTPPRAPKGLNPSNP